MRLLLFILAVMSTLTSFGINCADSVNVYFSVGRCDFEPSLRGNREVMAGFIRKVRQAVEDGGVERITVFGYASPDGSPEANERIARNRSTAVARYIVTHTGVNPALVEERPAGIGWNELRRLVAANPDVPCRRQVLDILDSVPGSEISGKTVDDRKKRLMDLAEGGPWRWMYEHLFPGLRNAVAVSLYPPPGNLGQRGCGNA